MTSVNSKPEIVVHGVTPNFEGIKPLSWWQRLLIHLGIGQLDIRIIPPETQELSSKIKDDKLSTALLSLLAPAGEIRVLGVDRNYRAVTTQDRNDYRARLGEEERARAREILQQISVHGKGQARGERRGNTPDFLTILGKAMGGEVQAQNLVRGWNRIIAEDFIAQFRNKDLSQWTRGGGILVHSSKCFAEVEGRSGYQAILNETEKRYGISYSTGRGHATPVIDCKLDFAQSCARVRKIDPMTGRVTESVFDGLPPRIAPDGKTNILNFLAANNIQMTSQDIETLWNRGRFSYLGALEDDNSPFGVGLRELLDSKLQRYQFDGQHCVPYSFFMMCLINALQPGDSYFKQSGRMQLYRDFGIYVMTREELERLWTVPIRVIGRTR